MAIPLRLRTLQLCLPEIHGKKTLQRKTSSGYIHFVCGWVLPSLALNSFRFRTGVVLPLSTTISRRTRWDSSLGSSRGACFLRGYDNHKHFSNSVCFNIFRSAFSTKYDDKYNNAPRMNHSFSAKFAASIGFDAYMPKAVRERVVSYPPAVIAAMVTTLDMIVSAPPFLTLLGDGAWVSLNQPGF